QERKVSLGSWRIVLGLHMNQAGPQVTGYRYQTFFADLDPSEQAVTSVVRKWLARPTGAQDLISTLHILFGDV
ncbi:hypothetical protein ACXWOR_10780, partial [Streptococcus pyogenes]